MGGKKLSDSEIKMWLMLRGVNHLTSFIYGAQTQEELVIVSENIQSCMDKKLWKCHDKSKVQCIPGFSACSDDTEKRMKIKEFINDFHPVDVLNGYFAVTEDCIIRHFINHDFGDAFDVRVITDATDTRPLVLLWEIIAWKLQRIPEDPYPNLEKILP